MDQHGIGVGDIEAYVAKRGGRKLSAKSAASPVRYRDPKSGATWTGHGRAPSWIANAKDHSKFLVAAVPTSAREKKVTKAGNYVRGTQPALYRDPKTGATWSGRGRALAWLAEAKDRKKFLIKSGRGRSRSDGKAAATEVASS